MLGNWRNQHGFSGLRVAAVAGEKTNIKITTAEDWRLAATLEAYLQ